MIIIVDNGSKHTDKIRKHLVKRGVKAKVLKDYKQFHTLLHHPIKGIILSGGPLLYDSKFRFSKIAMNFASMLSFDVPVLGICFGHQTLVEGFGGKVKRMKKEIRGPQKITLVKRGRLFKGMPKEFDMYQAHLDCGLRVPPHFDVVAKSSRCSQEAIQHRKKHIYGVQFHPENSGEMGEKFLDNFLEVCGKG